MTCLRLLKLSFEMLESQVLWSIKRTRFKSISIQIMYKHTCARVFTDFFFFIFYGLQLFLAVAVGRPIPHTAHLRDCSTGSIGYSYEVRPTFRLLPWAISPTHCTTRSQLTIIDSIGQRRLRQYKTRGLIIAVSRPRFFTAAVWNLDTAVVNLPRSRLDYDDSNWHTPLHITHIPRPILFNTLSGTEPNSN